MTTTIKSLTAISLAFGLFCSPIFAAVPPSEVPKLGTSLTPAGAEKAGNASGEIPAWEGGLPQNAGAVDNKGFLADPFFDEKPLFVITAQNMDKYKERLTPGQQAMFQRYPETYRMPVFKTHRTAGFPQDWFDMTRKNATEVNLVAGGNGVENYHGGIPFPIPQNGLEIISNHQNHYAQSMRRDFNVVSPMPDGAYTLVRMDDEIMPFFDMKNPPDNLKFYLKISVTSPARLAGDVTLIHEPLDQVKEPRSAWIYNAGQRRVRRAPQVAYDGPGTASDGMRTQDNYDMFNGAPDRYDWQLVGKKEMYIPYNSYHLDSPSLKYDEIIKAGHVNQDLTRYELHRVWHVTATLKPGMRHIYAKRDFYIDEDSWLVSEVDHYDGRGTLWRVGEAHAQFYYHKQLPWYTIETLYDLVAGRYHVIGLKNESPHSWAFRPADLQESSFTPAALRQAGIR